MLLDSTDSSQTRNQDLMKMKFELNIAPDQYVYSPQIAPLRAGRRPRKT